MTGYQLTVTVGSTGPAHTHGQLSATRHSQGVQDPAQTHDRLSANSHSRGVQALHKHMASYQLPAAAREYSPCTNTWPVISHQPRPGNGQRWARVPLGLRAHSIFLLRSAFPLSCTKLFLRSCFAFLCVCSSPIGLQVACSCQLNYGTMGEGRYR